MGRLLQVLIMTTGICRIGLDLSIIHVDLRQAFRIEHFSIDIVLSKQWKSFKGRLRLVIFGNTLDANLDIDASSPDFFLDAVLGEVRKFVTGVFWVLVW